METYSQLTSEQRYQIYALLKNQHSQSEIAATIGVHKSNGTLPSAELNTLKRQAEIWRKRLIDISWFMRALNEPIARWANAEDNVTGHFFEGRFKSQSLLDQRAILSCITYVDLNPIRARIASTPESSDYTSVQKRIKAAGQDKTPSLLMPFTGGEHKAKPTNGIPFALKDYLVLVEATGQIARQDKLGRQTLLTRF